LAPTLPFPLPRDPEGAAATCASAPPASRCGAGCHLRLPSSCIPPQRRRLPPAPRRLPHPVARPPPVDQCCAAPAQRRSRRFTSRRRPPGTTPSERAPDASRLGRVRCAASSVLRHTAARRDKGATAQGIPGAPVPPAVPRSLHPEGPKPRTSVPHWCQVSTFSSETLHLSHCSVFSSIHLNLTY